MKDLIKQIYQSVFKSNSNDLESNLKENFPKVGFLSDIEIKNLESVLNIKIHNVGIFEQALTHRSFLQVHDQKPIRSNERLEFLGDAILQMVVTNFLFHKYIDSEEGDLTKLRSKLVSRKALSICAYKLDLLSLIKMSFSAFQSVKNGSQSILSDTVEALIAAVFIEHGIEGASRFILEILIPIMLDKKVLEEKNYKSNLLELAQSLGHKAPYYEVLNTEGPDHNRKFTVGAYVNSKLLAKGIGNSKKQAEQNAAKLALNNLNLENLN